ncbi:MAG: TonB-dependent receptor [Proteiniphilum sp.]|nr:TonB-dependent receptor [Proteiniphilum sp.]NCB24362.1 hypothetical protein [Bacteroidia bacterium]
MNILKTVLLIIGCFVTANAASQESGLSEPDSTVSLPEVVINAYQIQTRQHQVPGAISLLSGEEIRTTDGNNFAHTLHAIPGIYMHSGTYATGRIVIRGVGSRTPYSTNRIKSYLNDIPITSSDGISTPEDIDLMGIGRMEVIKGPASALYGSGLGGNINLYTQEGENNHSEALVQYGSFQTIKAAAAGNYHREKLQVWGNLSHLQTEGHRENSRLKRTSLLSSGSWQQPRYTVEYTLMVIDLYAQIPSSVGKTLYENDPAAAASNWKAIEGYKEYQRAIAGVTLTNRFLETWNNKLTLFGRWADSYERRPFNNLDDGTSGGGLRNRMTHHAAHWDALIGFEWIKDTYRWKMDIDSEPINRNREHRNHYNLFGMLYWRPARAWNISLGGAVNRVHYRLADQFPENGDQSGKRNFPALFSPRLGLNYAPSQNLALYASAGHGFSMPSPEETLLPEGNINETLQPEQGMQYEAGIRLHLFNNATRLEASVYRIDLNNLLVTKRVTEDIFTGINAGKTRHAGVEFMLQQRVFSYPSFPGTLSLNANYTYARNRFIDFEDDGNVYNGNHLPGVPSGVGRATIQWQPVQPLQVSTQLQQVGPQYIDDANTIENEGYFLTDLKFTYLFSTPRFGTFKLFAGLNNLANIRYSAMLTVNAVAFGNAEPRYYYPGMPRHYFTGVNWLF